MLVPENGSKNGRHLKILAEINLDAPLLRGTKIRFQDQVVWVIYEKMAMFCFYCRKVGHSEMVCPKRKRDLATGCIQEGQYGDWLKAEAIHPGAKQSKEVAKDK